MKVTYPTCCGVDVHKSFLVATIIKTTGGIEPSYQKKRFSTFNNSILEFKSWLLENDCHDVCMESTGKYWVPVFNLLEDQINVTIANPKWVKAVKGNKDDTKDSKWIGDLFRLGLVKGSYIPCKSIRILREYTRYRYKLVSCRSSEKNRYQNALTVCNVALDSVVSDIFGKSSTSIIDYLLEQSGTTINHEEIASKLLRSLKSKEDTVIESIEGYQMTDSQKYRMRLVRAHMDYITAGLKDVDKQIDFLISSDPDYDKAIQLLTTIPGVKHIRKSGKIAIVLRDNDELISVKATCGNNDIVIGASNGRMVRFAESEIRSMGRSSSGVKGIELDGAIVVGADAVEPGHMVLIVTANGYGKKSLIDEYRLTHRGSKGVKAYNVTDKNGVLVSLKCFKQDALLDLIMMTNSGIIIKLPLDQVSTLKRATQGVRLMNLKDDQKVSTVALVEKDDTEDEKDELDSDVSDNYNHNN